LDELDVKIIRALVSTQIIAPSSTKMKASLREIGRSIGIDDETVRRRFMRLQEKGMFSSWTLQPNPAIFGFKAREILVDIDLLEAKDDMIRKLKLIEGIAVIINFYGTALQLVVFYQNDQSLARLVELVSRITNAEKITLIQSMLPKCDSQNLSESDWAIISVLGNNPLKSLTIVAQETGYSTKTVKNRLEKLERDHALFIPPDVSNGAMNGMIAATLFYSYMDRASKSNVDQEMLSHFSASYMWCRLTDPDIGYLTLVFPSLLESQKALDWAKQQKGVASARLEIVVECMKLFEKLRESIPEKSIVDLELIDGR